MKTDTAIILLSGGLDSATTLAIAANENSELYALSFYYGQRHKKELLSARKLAKYYCVKEHKILKIDLTTFGGSALTDKKITVPTNSLNTRHSSFVTNIPVTYVPARNIIFLSFALAYAEVKNANSIYIGANAIDFSGYPDCRPEFFSSFMKMASVGTKRGVQGNPIKIKTPLQNLSKAQIIKKGYELKVPYELTWSCYQGKKFACGKCDSCLLRLKGFREAGLKDPVKYEKMKPWS